MPRWGFSDTADLVEPDSAHAADGFVEEEAPPAQWINYLLHYQLAWCDYLRGPGWGAWTREDHGSSTDLTAVAGAAVDVDDSRASSQRVRYAIVGAQSGPAPHIVTSKNGRAWTDRGVPTAFSGDLRGIAYGADRWILWGTGAGEVWTTPADTGSNNSAVRTGTAAHWSTLTAASVCEVGGAAWNGGTSIYLVDRVTGGTITVVYTTNSGSSWSTRTVSIGASINYGADIVYDDSRSRYTISTASGAIGHYTPSTGLSSGLVATLSGVAADVDARLRVGGPDTGRTLLAWASYRHDGTTALTATQLWRSTDGGSSWSAITLPAAMRASGGAAIVTDVQHVDGAWIATTSAAPYLWRSDDDGQNWERVPLPVAEESSWALHRAVYADGQILATGLTWAVTSARASATSPGTWTSREPSYLADAGYLRGRAISTTAPADGEVLVWDAGTSRWVPGSAGSASPTTTRGDLIVRGASADQRLALGASSTLLVSDGTDAVWGSLDDVLAGSDGDVVVRRAGSWSSDRLDAAAGDIDGLPWHASVGPATVQTTDATTTTAVTIATTTDKGHALDLVVSATKSDRSTQVAWKILATITNAAGVCAVRDALITASDPGTAWTATVDVSGTNVRVRVTGAGGTTVDWCCAGSMLVHGS